MVRPLKSSILFMLALSASGVTNALANDAGCGLGNIIMPRNTKLSQSLAVTTNATAFNQLFGITSGTSDCTSSQWIAEHRQAVHYAEANFHSLKIEMARGQGENLTAFTQVLGCNKEIAGEIGDLTRSSYQKIFPTQETSPAQMVENVHYEIQQNPAVRKNCPKLS